MASKAIEIITRVKDLVGITSSITSEDTNILRRMNDVQWWLFHAQPNWRGLQSYQDLTATHAVAYVTVPSDVAGVFSIRSEEESGNKLTYISPMKFNALMPDAAAFSEGEPLYYTWWGGRFWFYPIPDDTYTFKMWYYKKPVNLKLYSAGTSQHTVLAVTGTSTYFSTNANVDTNMFYAYQGDVRSDGTYPWSTITAVTAATTMTIAAYAGGSGGSTVAYYASSEMTFPTEFDLLIQQKAALLTAGRNREDEKFFQMLQGEVQQALVGLVRSQTYVPDHTPILEDFSPSGIVSVGETWNQPFVRSN